MEKGEEYTRSKPDSARRSQGVVSLSARPPSFFGSDLHTSKHATVTCRASLKVYEESAVSVKCPGGTATELG